MTPVPTTPAVATPPAVTTPADQARREKIHATASEFEGAFLSIMLQQMFSGLNVDAPFGGGLGEDLFRSVMTEAMGKQIARSGGVGLADTVSREMLKMQGLT